MANYVTYDSMSGEIRTWGSSDTPPPVAPDHGQILWDTVSASPATHYVIGGVLTAYSTPQRTAKATAPTYPAVWSNADFAWEDQRSLDQAKADTWTAVRIARDANQAMGFMWDGSKFDSDDTSIQRIQGAVTLAQLALGQGQPFSIVWTLYDNTTRTMTAMDMIGMFAALGVFVQTIFTAGVALRNQINSATSVNQLHNIVWVNIS